MDGNEDGFIGNVDVLGLLLNIGVSSSNFVVRRHALICIQDSLAANSLNLVAMARVKGVDSLFRVLGEIARAIDAPDCSGASNDGRAKSDQQAYVLQVVNLLNYIGVLSVYLDFNVFHEYTRLLMELDLPVIAENNTVVLLMMRSASRYDFYRVTEIEFLTVFWRITFPESPMTLTFMAILRG